jgi:HEAT repeat protein
VLLTILQVIGTLATLITVGIAAYEIRTTRLERAEQRTWQQLDRLERSLDRLGRIARCVETVRAGVNTIGFQMQGASFLWEQLAELDREVLGSPDRVRLTACARLATIGEGERNTSVVEQLADDADEEIAIVRQDAIDALQRLTGAHAGPRGPTY